MNELTVQEAVNLKKRHARCFATNATKDISFRLEMLGRLKWAIRFYESEILTALHKDLGKHATESFMTEVGYVYKSIDLMKKQLPRAARPVAVKTPYYMLPAKSYLLREPYGTVLIIGPFNYPFQLLMEPLVGAIAAGNCAVLKPSELTPSVATVVGKIVRKAFRPSYVSCVFGGAETNTALLQAGFDYIFFTGSPAIGKIVMEAAAKTLTPVTLELGGKSPVIVCESANLRQAARQIVWGKLLNVGQTCVAPDYVLVDERLKDALTKELKRAIHKLYGKHIKTSASYGRIVNERHMRRLISILEKDANQIIFGGSFDLQNRYMEPTLLTDVTWDSACMQEELFGPILPILTFTNLNSALKEINKRHKPLALYLFSKDKEEIGHVLQKTSSGGACINDVISHVVNPNLPFGGVGNSGIGAYHAKESFLTFSHTKSVYENYGSISNALSLPPYTKLQDKLIKLVFH